MFTIHINAKNNQKYINHVVSVAAAVAIVRSLLATTDTTLSDITVLGPLGRAYRVVACNNFWNHFILEEN